jgi:hypothetical protein
MLWFVILSGVRFGMTAVRQCHCRDQQPLLIQLPQHALSKVDPPLFGGPDEVRRVERVVLREGPGNRNYK